MEGIKYFQYQKELDYPVFLRFENKNLEAEVLELIELFGFTALDEKELKSISLKSIQTTVLKFERASNRVVRQIDQSSSSDLYGPENITQLGSYDVYRYKNVAMMMFGQGNFMWELGVKDATVNQLELKAVLTRFLSWALAPIGVFGFWGVPVEEGIVVQKPYQSKNEVVFIDIVKKVMITFDGVKPLDDRLQVLRLDPMLQDDFRAMKPEELFSFLCTNTTYLSYKGLHYIIKNNILEFSKNSEGIIYPEASFQPRSVAA